MNMEKKYFSIMGIIAVIIIIGAITFMNNEKENKSNENGSGQSSKIKTYDSGLIVEILAEGTGSEVSKNDDNISVHYTGTLANGTKFDSSIDRNEPFVFKLGQRDVIKGWDLGLLNMKVGEKRKLTIPPELGYGDGGFPPIIPQNATLTFVVELIAIN